MNMALSKTTSARTGSSMLASSHWVYVQVGTLWRSSYLESPSDP